MNTDIRKARSNDGSKIVATIETYEEAFCGFKDMRTCQTVKIIVNRLKGVVTITYIRDYLNLRPAETLVVQLEELLTHGLIYKHLLELVDQVSMGRIDSKKLVEELVKDSSR